MDDGFSAERKETSHFRYATPCLHRTRDFRAGKKWLFPNQNWSVEIKKYEQKLVLPKKMERQFFLIKNIKSKQ